jgi:ribosomal 50S subunit-associated protein YjgA (DUF615 family)
MREFDIDIKATQEAFHGLEQVNERIVACTNILDCLIHSYVRKIPAKKPKKIVRGVGQQRLWLWLSQEEGTIEAASEEINTFRHYSTYQTDSLAKRGVCRKRMQDMDYTLERFHHFAFDPSKFIEGLCLPLKDRGDRLNRITLFEFLDERMIDQVLPGLLFISLQGSLEERLKRRVRRVTHITGGRRRDLSSVRKQMREETIDSGRGQRAKDTASPERLGARSHHGLA